MQNDNKFYMQINEIYKSHFNNYHDFTLKNVKELLKDPTQAKYRETLFDQIKVAHYHKRNGNIFSYIFRPIESPILELTENDIFMDQFNHTEYYPIVNTRVF